MDGKNLKKNCLNKFRFFKINKKSINPPNIFELFDNFRRENAADKETIKSENQRWAQSALET